MTKEEIAESWVNSVFYSFDWVMAVEWDGDEVSFYPGPSSAREYRKYSVTRVVMETMDRDLAGLSAKTWNRPAIMLGWQPWADQSGR